MDLMPMPSYDVMLAAVVFIAVLAGLLAGKALLTRQLRRLAEASRFNVLGYVAQVLGATRLPFLCWVALLAGVSQLTLNPRQEKWLNYAWIIILVSQIALWANRIVTVAVERAFERQRTSNPASATHLMLAGLVARIVLWSVAVLVTLDNLGFNITTLMASLGIGGIAVALAVQNILGDIFSSVSIALDKPFVIGDFIVVDSYMGTVEYVGMKTTRIRSLGGEQIIFSNNELLKNRIRNYKRMQERRVLFEFGVAYETPIEQVRALPGIVREIVSSQLQTRFDRAHFKGYGDSALQFEVVYFVLDPDFNKYMDIQQAINLALLEALAAREVAFAHPVRMLRLAPEQMRAAASHLAAITPADRAA
ncbi:mechanosensitive ion channel family protein [Noviherbaspirillum sp. 1P10PC]|uniref:mechanosensitive ion channel family protein n=1 Tax=Noviherbaspirillum sp. 1P10PC TaxID=3132292 RepID=UPI0039A23588